MFSIPRDETLSTNIAAHCIFSSDVYLVYGFHEMLIITNVGVVTFAVALIHNCNFIFMTVQSYEVRLSLRFTFPLRWLPGVIINCILVTKYGSVRMTRYLSCWIVILSRQYRLRECKYQSFLVLASVNFLRILTTKTM